ncbi:Aste57867_8163 [Aphanomyces stellatus]|uniref:Aste57867_8163 protein n=1 Tax=Aphanomyces stellatus TaxID=120398 RepID=A0A485KJL5_9STRA|nr:hypothetical protein As57867_008133 [Aphanomyces stellatus]VFT85051.1 Aste57867_8163 [Aphanomyces stellatus]
MSYSILASIQWYFQGRSRYGARGYELGAAKWPKEEPRDLSSHHYVVTGANSGIGLAVAEQIAAAGAHVHMVCRNPARGEAARQGVVAKTGADDARVHLHIADMSKLADVHAVADDLVQTLPVLHGLVNNAGLLADKLVITDDNIESSRAVALLGTFVLTARLLPLLAKADDVGRVVNMSSGGQYLVSLDLNDVRGVRQGKFDGTMAYGQAKKAQVALSRQFARLFPLTAGSNVCFNAMNPGWAITNGTEKSLESFTARHRHLMRDADQAADTATWLCLSKAGAAHSGLFFLDREPVATEMPLSGTGYTDADLDKLWQTCVEIFKLEPKLA